MSKSKTCKQTHQSSNETTFTSSLSKKLFPNPQTFFLFDGSIGSDSNLIFDAYKIQKEKTSTPKF